MARTTSLLADWVRLIDNGAISGQAFADALLVACANLPDEVLRALPALPDGVAESLASEPLAEHVSGVYLPAEWLEALCAALELPLADIDGGWDVSDGEAVYFCPLATVAADAHDRDDARLFVRLDQIRRWPEPPPR